MDTPTEPGIFPASQATPPAAFVPPLVAAWTTARAEAAALTRAYGRPSTDRRQLAARAEVLLRDLQRLEAHCQAVEALLS
jgi:hypothetical protein